MAERCDEESLFCGESVRALADAGFMGLPYPPEQGGRGSSYESYVRCVERLSKACPSVGVTYATHVGLACHPLHAFGSPMQKESFLRPMLRGDKLGAFALTEPEAGSDVGAIATTAELDGGFYVINGHKIFITNAGRADIYILFARTGGQGTEGLSAFVVCSDDAGLLISAPQRKMGIRGAATSDETYEAAKALSERLGKTAVTVNEYPGFVVNRILIPMINEAVFMLQEGVASAEDIDTAMKLGANHPMGPLALADLIGLDVCLAIMELLRDEMGEGKYRPAPLLRKMVRAGRLGRKSGEGFFRY